MTNQLGAINECDHALTCHSSTDDRAGLIGLGVVLAVSIAAGPQYTVPADQVAYVSCVAHRESNDHPNSISHLYRGLFQFNEALKDGATWMMLDWIRTWHPKPLRFAAHLRDMPMNRWPRNLQVAAFVETLNDGGKWSGMRHWSGGRWHCGAAS